VELGEEIFAMIRLGVQYGCGISIILFLSLFIFSDAAEADPKDYKFSLPSVGKGPVILRLTNIKRNSKVKISSFSESILQVGPQGKPGTMRMRAIPVFDPKTGDYIYKLEPGMVVHELSITARVAGESDAISATLPGTSRGDESNRP
jgi:hypothetical protein